LRWNAGKHVSFFGVIYLNCSFEETFAAFAGDDPVVKAGGLVLADVADQRLLVLRGRDQQ